MTTQSANPLDEFDTELWEQSSIHNIISRVMSRPDHSTFKFDGDMVQSSKPLWDWAEYVVDHFAGDWDLMVKFRTLQRTGTQLSKNQLAVALNSLLKCWKRHLAWVEAAKASAATPATRQYPTSEELFDQVQDVGAIKSFRQEIVPNSEGGVPSVEPQDTINSIAKSAPEGMKVKVKMPHPGTYTFVDQDGNYRVIKFSAPDKKIDNGNMYVSYQYGSDNVRDFAKCGKIDSEGMLAVWGSAFRRGESVQKHTAAQRADLLAAIVFICSFDKDAQLKAGEAYALKSGVCFVCGRDLTVPSSISAGMGPICAEKWGM